MILIFAIIPLPLLLVITARVADLQLMISLFLQCNQWYNCILSRWIKGFCCAVLAMQHWSVLFYHTAVLYGHIYTAVLYESRDSYSTDNHMALHSCCADYGLGRTQYNLPLLQLRSRQVVPFYKHNGMDQTFGFQIATLSTTRVHVKTWRGQSHAHTMPMTYQQIDRQLMQNPQPAR